jgi:ABC-type polysaccharide transport system permease subunit
VKGDFEEDASIVYRIFVLLSTFISNVVLLNLIIAFMSDSYGNVMQTIYEKKNKTLNFMTLRLEKVIFWEKEIGKTGYLIWIDYVKEISAAASNKTMELDEIIEIKTKECLNEFS